MAQVYKNLKHNYYISIKMHYTAIAGSDYTNASSVEIFTSGSTHNAARCINISILEDISYEVNETFTLMLTTPDPNVTIGNSETTITITDTDCK